jgi:RNA 2',3'-cyclic 3'-phosphodiesterase
VSDRDRVRGFLAVPPDPGWVESARDFLARIRPLLPDASWTRPESWHLTLRFLGEVSREWLSGFAAAIGRAAERLAASELSTRGAVVFPPHGPARVLGIGFETKGGAGALSDLAREAERVAREMGLASERRVFHPHVTFARLRRPWPGEAIACFREEAGGWAFPVWPVRSCVLYESLLTPEGAVHTPVGQWALPAPEGMTA